MWPAEYRHDGETYLQFVFDFITSQGRVVRFKSRGQLISALT